MSVQIHLANQAVNVGKVPGALPATDSTSAPSALPTTDSISVSSSVPEADAVSGSAPGLVSDAVLARQIRTSQLEGVGVAGLARLNAARVLVVGAGGLGSPVLSYLAAGGIGTLGISDSDVVDESNLQRQIIHCEKSVGSPKTQSAATRVTELNSSVSVIQHPGLSSANIDSICGAYDLLMDCADSFETKYLVADWCAENAKPLVWGTVVGTTFQVSVFWSAPPGPYRPTSLRELFGEIPVADTTPSADEIGVLGPAVGVCGSVMAGEAMKLIAGFGQPLLGRVLVGDISSGRFDVLRFG